MGLISLERNSAMRHVVGCWGNRSRPTTQSQWFTVDVQGSTSVLTVSPILRLALHTQAQKAKSAHPRDSSLQKLVAKDHHGRGPPGLKPPFFRPCLPSAFFFCLRWSMTRRNCDLIFPTALLGPGEPPSAKRQHCVQSIILASVPMSPPVQCIQGSMKHASRKHLGLLASPVTPPPSHPNQQWTPQYANRPTGPPTISRGSHRIEAEAEARSLSGFF
ncbi:hypothetical protein C8Q74DRAFT_19474 [Fomes fomentarius]|nr:hypothetical protein C8Q74DRAFT_19474 [Fomes fomentarius]